MHVRCLALSFGLTSILLTSAVSARGEELNLVPNGGFEQVGKDGWATGWSKRPKQMPTGASVEIDNAVFHSGKRSLRISHTEFSFTRAHCVVPVKPNTRYVVSFWVKGVNVKIGPQGKHPRLYLIAGGRTLVKINAISPGQAGTKSSWKHYEIGPFKVGKTDKLTCRVQLRFSSGTVWFDDIRLTELTPQINRRISQGRVRTILLNDLKTVEKAAGKAGNNDVLAKVSELRKRIQQAKDLPEKLDRRRGPPFFPLHRQVYRLMARLHASTHPNTDMVMSLADPFSRQPALAFPTPGWVARAAEVEGIRNDTEQIAINLTNLTERKITAKLSAPDWPVKSRVKWRVVIPVELSEGVMIDDGLPLAEMADDSAAVSVPAGMTRQVWLTINTGAHPGSFTGRIRVGWANRKVELPIQLRIHDLQFPKTWPIYTFGYSYVNRWPLTKSRIPQAVKDLAAHHSNCAYAPDKTFGLPRAVFDDQGNLVEDQMDWSKFDAALEYSKYVQTFIFHVPLASKYRINAKVGSPEWESMAVKWVRYLIEGMKQRGIGYDRMLWASTDEPSGAAVKTVIACGKAFHKADPNIRVYSNFYRAATPEDVRRMDPVINVWAPSIGCLKKEYLSICRQPGKELWSYRVTGKGARPESIRGAFWRVFREGIRGYSFWCYADAVGDPWDPYDTPRHDYAVVYDGDPRELIPSKRWEAWREGIEDYTLLWMLKQKIVKLSPARKDEAVKILKECERIGMGSTAEQIARARAKLLKTLISVN